MIASAIKINQKLLNIAHSRNRKGKDMIIAILRKDSNSSATTRRSARIKRNWAWRAASSALAARDMARDNLRF